MASSMVYSRLEERIEQRNPAKDRARWYVWQTTASRQQTWAHVSWTC